MDFNLPKDSKLNKMKDKYTNKLHIIENNCNLSEEEKYKTYKSLLKNIDKEIVKNQKNYDLNNHIYEKNDAKDIGVATSKVTTGIIGALQMIVGLSLTAEAVMTTNPVFGAIGGALVGLSAILGLKEALTTSVYGRDSVVGKFCKKVSDECKTCDNALKKIQKQVKDKVMLYESKLNPQMEY